MSMNIGVTNDQGFMDMVGKDFKQVDKRGTSRVKNLEDLRNPTGKASRTSDLEKLEDDKTGGVSEKNEAKLSAKAQSLLRNLRRLYGDFDFFVGNGSDDLKALSKSSSKEFSVIFSNDELEKMADDANYAKEKIRSMENAARMSRKISEQNGQISALANAGNLNGTIRQINIMVDDKGGIRIFAELEEISEKQRERIEKGREKHAEEKKKAENEAKDPVKRTTVEAGSVEELLEKIQNLDWDEVPDERPGERFSFTV